MSEQYEVNKEELPEIFADLWDATDTLNIKKGFENKAQSLFRAADSSRTLRELVQKYLTNLYKADKIEISWPKSTIITIWKKKIDEK